MKEFEEFYEQVYPAVARFARSRTGNPQAAEDLTADALILVYSRWSQLASWLEEPNGEARLRNYIFGVVRNLARDFHRRAQKGACVVAAEVAECDLSTADSTSSYVEILASFEEAFAGLSNKQSQALLMEMSGYSTAEIARSLAVVESTARSHLASARRLVRDVLFGGIAARGESPGPYHRNA